MLILKNDLIASILKHAEGCLPNEACGLLGGRVEGDRRIVEKVYFLRNIDESPEHFSMEPREQFRAVSDIRGHGWTLIGNFHSHPASPARPSEEDKRLAFDPELSYMIFSFLRPEGPVFKCFRIVKNAATEEEYTIVGETQ